MRCKKKDMLLYAVTDRAWVGELSLLQQVEAAIKGGVTCVQLREKSLDDATFLEEAFAIGKLCRGCNVPFIVNDNVEIAVKCGADGVHVGQMDMEASNVRALVGNERVIGVSAQTVEQAIAAEKAGVDYLGVGAVFTTNTKLDANSVTYKTLKEICASVKIPVVAIGGINKDNILSLAGSGVDGVALVSAIFASQNIEKECSNLKKLAARMVAL